jgi:peptidoglycan DL-endopeptidase CwlO
LTATSSRARHRSAGRPLTPLDSFASAATACLGTVGRRSAVVAAAGGLAVTMALPAAAAPTDGSVNAVDTSALTAPARSALATSPVVTVPTDVSWSFATPAITVKANPKPEPVPAPVVERRSSSDAPASRSTRRTAAPAEAPAESAPAPASAAAPSVSGNAVLDIAARYVGVPYVSGGSTPSGFDCSGFTSYVYAQLGINLPRASSAQRYAGTVVSRSEAKPGDLIWTPGHVGIYAGGNTQIDAPRPGKTIQFRAIWQSNPTFIRVS